MDSPYQLVRDSSVNSASAEESYIMRAHSTVSATQPILFEGTLNKSSTAPSDSSEYVLIYDNVAQNFKLEKFNGLIRMSKSRNESTLVSKLNKLIAQSKDKKLEESLEFAQRSLWKQQSLQEKSAVQKSKIVIPQDIPVVASRKLKNNNTKGKISTLKIREQLRKKQSRSPLVHNVPNGINSNSDIDDILLDESPKKIVQPKPEKPKAVNVGQKRLPSSQIATPILNQLQNELDSDSDLGSLAFELEEALEQDTTLNNTINGKRNDAKTNDDDDDGWGETNMDWDMIDDDFDLEDGDSNYNIVIEEPKSSQLNLDKNDDSKETREPTPSGPISMKELASLRASQNYSNSGPVTRAITPTVPTPSLASSSTFKQLKVAASLPTPKLADDRFSPIPVPKSYQTYLEDEEDISEEE